MSTADAASRLEFAVHDDGSLECVSLWLPTVTFPGTWLDRADGRRVILDSHAVTICCTNGTATYYLGPPDAEGRRSGRLLAVDFE